MKEPLWDKEQGRQVAFAQTAELVGGIGVDAVDGDHHDDEVEVGSNCHHCRIGVGP